MKVRRIIFGLVAAVSMATAAVPAFAVDSSSGSVQSYGSDIPLNIGTIVDLIGKNSDKVGIATQAELQNMFGVTVDRNQLPIAVTSGKFKNEAFVAVSGTYNVLVSTQGGPIAPGDYVTMSSTNGVAMKASTKEKTVFGRAASAFDGKGVTLGKTTLKDAAGGTKTVMLGLIPVTIDIRHNPNIKTTKVNVPDFLERIGQQIAEKEVSPVRLYIAVAIAVISLIAAIVVLYAGIRSGVISIGRNPMTKKSIFRAIIQTILTSLLILIVGLFAVYLLLKL